MIIPLLGSSGNVGFVGICCSGGFLRKNPSRYSPIGSPKVLNYDRSGQIAVSHCCREWSFGRASTVKAHPRKMGDVRTSPMRNSCRMMQGFSMWDVEYDKKIHRTEVCEVQVQTKAKLPSLWVYLFHRLTWWNKSSPEPVSVDHPRTPPRDEKSSTHKFLLNGDDEGQWVWNLLKKAMQSPIFARFSKPSVVWNDVGIDGSACPAKAEIFISGAAFHATTAPLIQTHHNPTNIRFSTSHIAA